MQAHGGVGLEPTARIPRDCDNRLPVGAVRRQGLTQPTLSRQVAALETSLAVELLERAGRKLTLTQTGAELRGRNLAAPGR